MDRLRVWTATPGTRNREAEVIVKPGVGRGRTRRLVKEADEHLRSGDGRCDEQLIMRKVPTSPAEDSRDRLTTHEVSCKPPVDAEAAVTLGVQQGLQPRTSVSAASQLHLEVSRRFLRKLIVDDFYRRHSMAVVR